MDVVSPRLRVAAAGGTLLVLGAGLRWITAGLLDAASTHDLSSLANVVVGAVGWAAYGWLVSAVVVTALERAPGAIGHSAAVVAGWITSGGSRALLRSALGVAAVSPLTIATAYATPGDGAPQQTVQRTWAAVEKPSAVRLGPTGFVPQGRAQQVAPGRRLGLPDRPTEGAPIRYTDLRAGREITPVRSPRHHVVRPADSLWALAAAELGAGASDAAVAARWPQWYAANNAVIGPDPDLLVPGQVLRVPGRDSEPSGSSIPEEN